MQCWLASLAGLAVAKATAELFAELGIDVVDADLLTAQW